MSQDDKNNSPEMTEKIEIFSTDDEKIKSFGELLTNDSSRTILQLLFKEEMTANQIAQKTGVSLQLVKYHINKMQDMGVVKISRIEKNTKAQDMKYYTATKFAIVILPKTVSEKAKESKSLLRSFKILYKFAGVGVAAVSAFFATQSIQNFTIVDEQVQDESIRLTSPTSEESVFQSGEEAELSVEPELDVVPIPEPEPAPEPEPEPEPEPTHSGVEQLESPTGSGYVGTTEKESIDVLEETLELASRKIDATEANPASGLSIIGPENFWPIIVAIAVLGIGLAVVFYWQAHKHSDKKSQTSISKLNLFGLTFLLFTVITFGTIGVDAQEIPDSSLPPLFVTTELSLYSMGSTVEITGFVKTLNENFEQPVIIRILDNNGNIVGIGQIMPSIDGSFSYQTKAGGTWNTSGEYQILVNYGAQKTQSTFEFIAGDATPPPIPVPPPPKCDSNQILVNGECIDKKPEEKQFECGLNQILVDDMCIDKEPEEQSIICGPGSTLIDGECMVKVTEPKQNDCLIATAAFGSKLAPQVQFLREIRDNTVLSTSSGVYFMAGFNTVYYSFSPTVADWERQNPIFKEGVKAFITPMISSLKILSFADEGSEMQVITLGLTVIALNIGLYIAMPLAVTYKINKYFKSRT